MHGHRGSRRRERLEPFCEGPLAHGGLLDLELLLLWLQVAFLGLPRVVEVVLRVGAVSRGPGGSALEGTSTEGPAWGMSVLTPEGLTRRFLVTS